MKHQRELRVYQNDYIYEYADGHYEWIANSGHDCRYAHAGELVADAEESEPAVVAAIKEWLVGAKMKRQVYGVQDIYGRWLQFTGANKTIQADDPDVFFSAEAASEHARQVGLKSGEYQVFNLAELAANPIKGG